MGSEPARRADLALSPRRIALGTIAVLLILCAGLATFSTDLTSEDSYRTEVESVEGQKLLEKSFPSGTTALTDIVVPEMAAVPAVREAVAKVSGVDAVSRPVATGEPGVLIQAILEPSPYSTTAFDLIDPIRKEADGSAAAWKVSIGDGRRALPRPGRGVAARPVRDRSVIVLGVILIVLIVLLRALVAPLFLLGTVILATSAALGLSVLAFDVVFGRDGIDPLLPILAFIFLVALGVDYNIFLMSRVREETIRHGSEQGILRALAVTGAVITSAGIVLAGPSGAGRPPPHLPHRARLQQYVALLLIYSFRRCFRGVEPAPVWACCSTFATQPIRSASTWQPTPTCRSGTRQPSAMTARRSFSPTSGEEEPTPLPLHRQTGMGRRRSIHYRK